LVTTSLCVALYSHLLHGSCVQRSYIAYNNSAKLSLFISRPLRLTPSDMSVADDAPATRASRTATTDNWLSRSIGSLPVGEFRQPVTQLESPTVPQAPTTTATRPSTIGVASDTSASGKAMGFLSLMSESSSMVPSKRSGSSPSLVFDMHQPAAAVCHCQRAHCSGLCGSFIKVVHIRCYTLLWCGMVWCLHRIAWRLGRVMQQP
jgi:hypothetical protein